MNNLREINDKLDFLMMRSYGSRFDGWTAELEPKELRDFRLALVRAAHGTRYAVTTFVETVLRPMSHVTQTMLMRQCEHMASTYDRDAVYKRIFDLVSDMTLPADKQVDMVQEIATLNARLGPSIRNPDR